jgi:hypothetical protein
MTTRRALVNIAGVTAEMPDGDALPFAALPVGTTANTVAAGDDSRITGAIQSSLLTTRGDVIRRGASAPQRLALGTTGHVYQSNGTDFVSGPLTPPAFPTGPGIVTPAMLDNGAALSLLGRSANSSGARADIAAADDDQVLAGASNALAFQGLTLAMAADGLWTYAKLNSAAIATQSEYRSATASKLLNAAIAFSAAEFASLSDAATIAVDLNAGWNRTVTLAGNRTLGNPSNTKPGLAGVVRVTASTSTRTLIKASNWKDATGQSWPISITTSDTVYLYFFVYDSSNIVITAVVYNPA